MQAGFYIIAFVLFQQRMSFSKYNVSCLNDTLYSGLASPNPGKRLRQNSVFVGSSTMAFMNPPRRTKSAFDIQHLVLNEASPSSVSSCNSLLPMITSFRERKPSIAVERANFVGRRRPSMATDRPLLAQHHYARNRRPSCCADRISLFGRQRNFTSFDQPTISLDRKTSISVEKSNCIVHQPTAVSFEKPSDSTERPFFVVDPPSTSQEYPPTCIAEAQITPIPFRKISLSFEQPSNVQPEKPPRMATSLDINAITLDRRSSITDYDRTSDRASDRASPISIILDETKITAPLIESLKSSDV